MTVRNWNEAAAGVVITARQQKTACSTSKLKLAIIRRIFQNYKYQQS
jgi:hypothetical protein